MNWTKDIEIWNTLFELKADHEKLGRKGNMYFVVDFVRDLHSDDFKNIVSAPVFSGFDVGVGTTSYVLTDEDLLALFQPIEKTLREYKKEMQDNYFKE